MAAAAAAAHHATVASGKKAARAAARSPSREKALEEMRASAAGAAEGIIAAGGRKKKAKGDEWRARQAVWDEQELLLRSSVSTKVLDRRRERYAGKIQGRWRRHSMVRPSSAVKAIGAAVAELDGPEHAAAARVTASAVHARVARAALAAQRASSFALEAVASANLERLSAEDRELIPDDALWTMRSGAMQQLRLAAQYDELLASDASKRDERCARLAHIAEKVEAGDLRALEGGGGDESARQARAVSALRRRIQRSLDHGASEPLAWWGVPARACAARAHALRWDGRTGAAGFDIRSATASCDFPTAATWEEAAGGDWARGASAEGERWWGADAEASQKWTLWAGGDLPSFASAGASKVAASERVSAVSRIDTLAREMVSAAYSQLEPRAFAPVRRSGDGSSARGGAARRRRGASDEHIAAAQRIQTGWRVFMEHQRARHDAQHYEQLQSVIDRCEEALTMAKSAFRSAKVDQSGGATARSTAGGKIDSVRALGDTFAPRASSSRRRY
jgi:hypothetical protein